MTWNDIKLLRSVAQDYATPSRFSKQVKIDVETGSFEESKKRINKLSKSSNVEGTVAGHNSSHTKHRRNIQHE